MTVWAVAVVIVGSYATYRACAAHARRVEREQREIAAYRPFTNPGADRVETSRWAAPDNQDGGV